MAIRSGDSSAARSSSCCRSRSSQKRCSGCAGSVERLPGSSSGSAPSNNAASSAASSTTVSLGSAALTPTLMPRLRAIAATSASRRLLPMPAAPSTTTTASAPSATRSSSPRTSASSASRPWNSHAGSVDIRPSRREYSRPLEQLSHRGVVRCAMARTQQPPSDSSTSLPSASIRASPRRWFGGLACGIRYGA